MTYEFYLLLACLVLLVILVVRQASLVHRQESSRLQQENSLVSLGNQLLDELDAQRDESVSSLQAANQNLLTTMSQMGQNQSSLLESMQRQVLLSTRNQEEKINALRLENERQLAEMRKTVDERLSESLDRKLDTSFAQVSERLESVYKGLGEMHSLAAGVGDLKKVLTNVNPRNLGRNAAGQPDPPDAGPPASMRRMSRLFRLPERVEFAIRLPDRSGGSVLLAVDSKFPQEDYIRLAEASQAGDAAGAEAARKALAQRLKAEAKKISSKYIAPPHTTDFAVMFLPVEGLYAEAIQAPDPLVRFSGRSGESLAGQVLFPPCSMPCRWASVPWRSNSGAAEVWRLLGRDRNRLCPLRGNPGRRPAPLDQAGGTIDSAVSVPVPSGRSFSGLEELPAGDSEDKL